MKAVPWLAAIIACCTGVAAFARELPNWPYERLMREADVVVVATPVAKRDVEFDFSKDRHFAPFLRDPDARPAFEKLGARVTTFEVIGMLRGELRDSVDVLHFYWTEDVSIENGPQFIEFTDRREVTSKIDDENGRTRERWTGEPQFLLFLRSSDKLLQRFEPVSGQMDPDLSIRLLIRP